MSILIKGMEMPKVPTRFIIFADGRVEDEDDSAYKYSALPVPQHGRLIDADALSKRIKDEGRHQAKCHADRYSPVVLAYADCCWKVESAPTIIPASEEGEK